MSLYYWVYEVLQQSGHGIHVCFLCILSEHDKKLKQKDQILWAWQKNHRAQNIFMLSKLSLILKENQLFKHTITGVL